MDAPDSGSTSASLVETRRQLHGIAECLFAGPEYEATGEIALRVIPGGFGTTAGPDLRLEGVELVNENRRVAAAGSFSELADRLGVTFGAPGWLVSIILRRARSEATTCTFCPCIFEFPPL